MVLTYTYLYFICIIAGEKIAQLAGADFRPDLLTDWLRNCYTEATALVDEHGVIRGKPIEKAQQSLAEQVKIT